MRTFLVLVFALYLGVSPAEAGILKAIKHIIAIPRKIVVAIEVNCLYATGNYRIAGYLMEDERGH